MLLMLMLVLVLVLMLVLVLLTTLWWILRSPDSQGMPAALWALGCWWDTTC